MKYLSNWRLRPWETQLQRSWTHWAPIHSDIGPAVLEITNDCGSWAGPQWWITRSQLDPVCIYLLAHILYTLGGSEFCWVLSLYHGTTWNARNTEFSVSGPGQNRLDDQSRRKFHITPKQAIMWDHCCSRLGTVNRSRAPFSLNSVDCLS